MKATTQTVSAHAVSPLPQESVKVLQGTARCEPLLNSKEAAQLLRIHPKTLQRMARQGKVPAIQIGKLWRFSTLALLAWQQGKLIG